MTGSTSTSSRRNARLVMITIASTDGFDEHGEEVSADEDSGGGDSGSDSGGDESLNSAELYDDQNNMTDARYGALQKS